MSSSERIIVEKHISSSIFDILNRELNNDKKSSGQFHTKYGQNFADVKEKYTIDSGSHRSTYDYDFLFPGISDEDIKSLTPPDEYKIKQYKIYNYLIKKKLYEKIIKDEHINIKNEDILKAKKDYARLDREVEEAKSELDIIDNMKNKDPYFKSNYNNLLKTFYIYCVKNTSDYGLSKLKTKSPIIKNVIENQYENVGFIRGISPDVSIEEYKKILDNDIDSIKVKIKNRNEEKNNLTGKKYPYNRIVIFTNGITDNIDYSYFSGDRQSKLIKDEYLNILNSKVKSFIESKSIGQQSMSLSSTITKIPILTLDEVRIDTIVNNIEEIIPQKMLSETKSNFNKETLKDIIFMLRELYKQGIDKEYKIKKQNENRFNKLNIYYKYNKLKNNDDDNKLKIGSFNKYYFSLINNEKDEKDIEFYLKESSKARKEYIVKFTKNAKKHLDDNFNTNDTNIIITIDDELSLRYKFKEYENYKEKFGSKENDKIKFENIPKTGTIVLKNKNKEGYKKLRFSDFDTTLKQNLNDPILYMKDTLFDLKSFNDYLKTKKGMTGTYNVSTEFLKINKNIGELNAYSDFIYENYNNSNIFNIERHGTNTKKHGDFLKKIHNNILEIIFQPGTGIYIKTIVEDDITKSENNTNNNSMDNKKIALSNYKIINFKNMNLEECSKSIKYIKEKQGEKSYKGVSKEFDLSKDINKLEDYCSKYNNNNIANENEHHYFVDIDISNDKRSVEKIKKDSKCSTLRNKIIHNYKRLPTLGSIFHIYGGKTIKLNRKKIKNITNKLRKTLKHKNK